MGVRRISVGGTLARVAMHAFVKAATRNRRRRHLRQFRRRDNERRNSTHFSATTARSTNPHDKLATSSANRPAGRPTGRYHAGATAGAGDAARPLRPHREARRRPRRLAVAGGEGRQEAVDLYGLRSICRRRRICRLGRRTRRPRRSLFLCRGRGGRRRRRHRHADGNPPGTARDRGRQYPLRHAAAAHAARHRGDVSAGALCLRDARLSPLRMEMRRAQCAVAARGVPLRLHLRGHFPPAHDHQGPQSRHRLVFHARQRMAGAQGEFRALAGAGKFHRRRTAKAELARDERRSRNERTRPVAARPAAAAAFRAVLAGAAVTSTMRLPDDGAGDRLEGLRTDRQRLRSRPGRTDPVRAGRDPDIVDRARRRPLRPPPHHPRRASDLRAGRDSVDRGAARPRGHPRTFVRRRLHDRLRARLRTADRQRAGAGAGAGALVAARGGGLDLRQPGGGDLRAGARRPDLRHAAGRGDRALRGVLLAARSRWSV